MSVTFQSLQDAVDEATRRQCSLGVLAVEYEVENTRRDEREIRDRMRQALKAMRDSVEQGRRRRGRTRSGLTGDEIERFAAAEGKTLGGDLLFRIQRDALAVSGLNAAMGRIVAAPTAGGCGILPAVLLNLAEELGADDGAVMTALFTASAIGLVLARRAGLAASKYGCQAECGTGSAMAAAAAAQLAGAPPEVVSHAAALALKNTLGLTCDPVGGLVEVPCVKRNSVYAVHALAACNLALAGIESAIPFDEVADAMAETGELMSPQLRESGLGGLAQTPTGRRLAPKPGKSTAVE